MDSLLRETVETFVEKAASDAPTPGGGSVAALAAALGAALGCMAIRFTVGKTKYADVDGEMRGLLARVEERRYRLMHAVDADARAYAGYRAAAALPRGTDEEKAARDRALADAAKGSCQPPLAVIAEVRASLALLLRVAQAGNARLVSDAACAAELLAAGARGAAWNVRANLPSIGDAALRDRWTMDLASDLDAATRECAAVLAAAAQRMA